MRPSGAGDGFPARNLGSTYRSLGLAPTLISSLKLLFLLITQLPLVRSLPFLTRSIATLGEKGALPAHDPQLWIYMGIAGALVLGGGAFAGLTIALMGQDEIYLQVLAESGECKERAHAAKVLKLLKRGKHWVLVTLLLGNVITNETLPIVLDRSLGGGWPAVLGSTVLIGTSSLEDGIAVGKQPANRITVIFGEIAPQSVCVRYGLPIGSYLAPLVLVLMYILAPIAWPTAALLDWLLGEDHGTTYKKTGLKTLVRLHKTIGESPDDRLEDDEVTIISAVLDLKEKPIGDIMTPMENVLTMSADEILDEDKMADIIKAGYSRIPVHEPGNDQNFLGMLLVKMLLSYDPEDCKSVGEFALATLPETKPHTSCLNMINFFQEGKSHMVLVSEYPGENREIMGVVTLEDVIEELIGEEIVDESDVYVDMQQMDKRTNQVEWSRSKEKQVVPKQTSQTNGKLIDVEEDGDHAADEAPRRPSVVERKMSGASHVPGSEYGTSPSRKTQLNTLLRRRSGSATEIHKKVNKHALTPAQKAQRKLGPSNLASAPKSTKFTDFKIKPGGTGAKATDNLDASKVPETVHETPSVATSPSLDVSAGIGAGLLENAGKDAKDGVHAVSQYGTISPGTLLSRSPSKGKVPSLSGKGIGPATGDDGEDDDSIGSLESKSSQAAKTKKRIVRSGSIAEKRVSVGGVNKIVLETTSSSSEENQDGASASQSKQSKQWKQQKKQKEDEEEGEAAKKENKQKKRKSRNRFGRKKKGESEGAGETVDEGSALLGGKKK